MKPEEIIEKTVVCAVVFVDKYSEDDIRESVTEFAGQVVEISEENGIVIANHETKRQINLPLCFEAFRPAEKGNYILRKGEIKVKDPDLLCEMTINREATE